MTAELVGPLPTIRFQDGSTQAYAAPRDTCDPRYRACAEHRPGCDCREAQLAETIAEYRGHLEDIRTAAREVLQGHATFAWEEAPGGDEREVGCMCTGCQIARKAMLLPSLEFGPHGRDETYGLSPEQREYGYRWKVCAPRLKDGPFDCGKVQTRDRGKYHEHLVRASGELVYLPEFDPEFECPF